MCDFCAVLLADSVTAFACRDFDFSPTPDVVVRFRNAWLACPGCAPLVQRRAWPALVDRVVTVHPAGESVRPHTVRLYRALSASLTGGYIVWGGVAA